MANIIEQIVISLPVFKNATIFNGNDSGLLYHKVNRKKQAQNVQCKKFSSRKKSFKMDRFIIKIDFLTSGVSRPLLTEVTEAKSSSRAETEVATDSSETKSRKSPSFSRPLLFRCPRPRSYCRRQRPPRSSTATSASPSSSEWTWTYTRGSTA